MGVSPRKAPRNLSSGGTIELLPRRPSRVVIGPVTGATVAAAYYKVINYMQDKEAENEPAADRPTPTSSPSRLRHRPRARP